MRTVIILALLGSAFAVPKSQTRIVGGNDTTVEQFPYMANMQYAWFGFWFLQRCGGSLITTTAVLSAAHCYEGDPASLWRVVLGTSFRSTGGTAHSISRIILHESYSGDTLDYDIAIVHLLNPAVLSNTIGVARIAGPNYNLPDGTSIVAVGWGHTQYEGSASEQLQMVAIDTINHEECVARYAYLKTQPDYLEWPNVTDNMLCAGIFNVGGKDACQGDSGGPVAHAGDILVGVTSWGFECADSFYPGVLARISVLSDWIVANSV